MASTFIKDEARYADWLCAVRHCFAKSPTASLNWSVYRNSRLENKLKRGVVLINTGSQIATVSASLDELKGNDLLAIAKERTNQAVITLTFAKQPDNDVSRETIDDRKPLSRRQVTAKKWNQPKAAKQRKRALVTG